MDLSGIIISPYVMETITNYWCELRLNLPPGKHKVVKRASITPEDAPAHNDFTDTMTDLMSIIHLHEAAYALDDNLLKRSSIATLRTRLVSMTYTSAEYLDAMDYVYKREEKHEQTKLLQKIFLSSAIVAHFKFTWNDKESGTFLQQQYWNPDFMIDLHKGLTWYYRHYLPSMRMGG